MLERTDSGLYRHRTIKTVKLSGGNFSVNIPVPAKALAAPPCTSSSSILHKHRSLQSGFEFSNLRYTAVIGDPDEFVPRGYTLRQREWGRQTELFVVITMYNEDEVLFIRTWKAVAKNIAHICSKKNTWGEQGWQKVVVCVVSDGRTKINARTLSVLGLMGVYQEGLIKLAINDDPVSAHVFEYTTQLVVDLDFKIKGPDSGHVPIQTIFCLKEKNAKKINSHRWFFNAFGRILLPKVCVLIDVGTKPTEPSLYRLWKGKKAGVLSHLIFAINTTTPQLQK